MRPKHWVKNGFVLGPLLYSGLITDTTAVVDAGVAFAFFCAAASAVYVLNDLSDVEADRKHPVKSKKRPIAAGWVSVGQARVLLAALVAAVALSIIIQPVVVPALGAYLGLNLLYSWKLKHLPVVDLFALSGGFVIRVWGGGLAIDVTVSLWMLITTLAIALFLASIKRMQELRTSGHSARSVLGSYSEELLRSYAQISATSAIVFYGMFIALVRDDLAPTLPFVIFGIMRYWHLVDDGGGESPTEALLKDPVSLLVVGAFVALSGYLVVG